MKFQLIAALVAASFAVDVSAATATFEDLNEANEQTYAGPGGGAYWAGATPPPLATLDTQFTSGGAAFLNSNTDFGGFTSWSGFAYSTTSDTTTPGFGNQYSAFPGAGADGSASYGVAFAGGLAAPRIEFASPTIVGDAMFTNTTYTALSMANGDSFAKQFGGPGGDEPDWFLLTITGLDAADAVTGTVDFYLADYRFSDNSLDYIVDAWTLVALDSLGAVSALEFGLTSSDIGSFGINTPLYFAVDNLRAVPIPAAWGLLLPACLVALRRRREHA